MALHFSISAHRTPLSTIGRTIGNVHVRSEAQYYAKTPLMASDVKDGNAPRVAAFDFRKGVKNLVDSAAELKKLPSEFVLPVEKRPSAASCAQLPVIDLAGLNGPPETRVSTVQAISSACQDWGFFLVMNHGVKESLIEEMLEAAEGFFGLSLEEKMEYVSDDVMSPCRFGTSLNTSMKHDLHWRDFLRHYGLHFQQHWPNNPPNYRQVAKEYLEQLGQMVMKLAGAISEGLGLESGCIEESLGGGMQILAANYYPPCPEPDKTLGLAAHSDHGGLTILTQNGVNGLQIKRNDIWTAVQHVPGSFLVNVGDFLEILSNGKYKSVEHRATVNGQKTRISIAVGYGPPLSSIIGPAAQLIDEEEGAHFQPIMYKDYVKIQQSTPRRGKSALEVISKR